MVSVMAWCVGPTCRFPVDWKGHYYQSGVGAVVIRGALVTTKGVCVEHERDYYLFSNRSVIMPRMSRRSGSHGANRERKCILAYRCLTGTAPSYLAETLHSTADVGSRRRLRSASKSTLVIPTTRRTTLGDRAFSVTAARAWNALPSSVRSAPSLLQFRRDLKTTLFQSSYSSP